MNRLLPGPDLDRLEPPVRGVALLGAPIYAKLFTKFNDLLCSKKKV